MYKKRKKERKRKTNFGTKSSECFKCSHVTKSLDSIGHKKSAAALYFHIFRFSSLLFNLHIRLSHVLPLRCYIFLNQIKCTHFIWCFHLFRFRRSFLFFCFVLFCFVGFLVCSGAQSRQIYTYVYCIYCTKYKFEYFLR